MESLMDAIPRVELPLLHLFPHLISLISYTYGLFFLFLALFLSLSLSPPSLFFRSSKLFRTSHPRAHTHAYTHTF